uniref:Uncharacterized protein n=1 Tax=Myotis myotis TaxID=51298 RepID=A0A7J7ZZM2_MYOMY|nr:hypothetical protein mMyoMyo1_010010 [Myotis myotis]
MSSRDQDGKTQRDEVHGDGGSSGNRSGWEEVETTEAELSGSRGSPPASLQPIGVGRWGSAQAPGGRTRPPRASVLPARLPLTLTLISETLLESGSGLWLPLKCSLKEETAPARWGSFGGRSDGVSLVWDPSSNVQGESRRLHVSPVHASPLLRSQMCKRVLRCHLQTGSVHGLPSVTTANLALSDVNRDLINATRLKIKPITKLLGWN